MKTHFMYQQMKKYVIINSSRMTKRIDFQIKIQGERNERTSKKFMQFDEITFI